MQTALCQHNLTFLSTINQSRITMRSRQMRFVGILDFHDSIADNLSAKQALIQERYGIRIPLKELSSERVIKHLTEQQYNEMRCDIYENVRYALRHVHPIPHSISTIRQLTRDGVGIRVATASQKPASEVARRWLAYHGQKRLADTLIQAEKVKAVQVRGYDMALENNLRQAIAYKSVGIPHVFLLSNPLNREDNERAEGIIRVKGYTEFYHHVQSLVIARSLPMSAREKRIA